MNQLIYHYHYSLYHQLMNLQPTPDCFVFYISIYLYMMYIYLNNHSTSRQPTSGITSDPTNTPVATQISSTIFQSTSSVSTTINNLINNTHLSTSFRLFIRSICIWFPIYIHSNKEYNIYLMSLLSQNHTNTISSTNL